MPSRQAVGSWEPVLLSALQLAHIFKFQAYHKVAQQTKVGHGSLGPPHLGISLTASRASPRGPWDHCLWMCIWLAPKLYDAQLCFKLDLESNCWMLNGEASFERFGMCIQHAFQKSVLNQWLEPLLHTRNILGRSRIHYLEKSHPNPNS